MKLRISMKEAVFTIDNDNDGEAEVPADREGETKPPDMNPGQDDKNNDGKTDIYSDEELIKMADEEGEPIDQLNQQIPDTDEPGDEELVDALSALEEQVMEAIKKIIHETQE